ncbi:MAG: sigma 54-interacting transcriptional regulator [Thermodesulfobacteriota bacterium]|nr:sigma 54-interacting transcriptional regulator [Thermodesulfobacteriota bacterium]
MKEDRALNVAIVGGGSGCKGIMGLILAAKFKKLRMNLIGVADVSSDTVARRYAQEQGIYTTQDYRDLYKLKNLDMIINMTGRDEVANEISQTKPDHVRVMDHVTARLFWDVFHAEEERTAERERAEKALREDRRFLQDVFEAIQDGMTILDCEFNIVRANPWMEKMYAPQMPLVGKKCYRAYQKRESPCPDCPARRTLATGEAHSEMVPYPSAENPTRWIDVSAFPLKNPTGRVVGTIEHIKDITKRKLAQEALRQSERELKRRHDELEAINRVLLRVTGEYNLNGMGRVLEDIMKGFYPGFDVWVFLLSPDRASFYFPRVEKEESRETCFDRAERKLRRLESEEALIRLLTRERMRPTCSGREKDDCPAVIQELAAGFRTWMAAPVELEAQCFGLFMLASPSLDMEVEDDLIFVETLIRQISGVIRYQISKEVREEAFRKQLTGPDKFMGIVGRSRPMQAIYRLIQSVADSRSTVLIMGESGTGKELVAHAIHRSGRYKETPFIVAHCSSFVPTLVHSEIFGHEKGAFTGALTRRRGRLERAQGGILFLDEVADLPLETQVLLLRFLQERSFERVGGERLVEVDVRVIAATNKDIEEEMKAGRIREDFYYRLNVISTVLPPLRERITDVPLLANHFLRTYGLIEKKEITGFDTQAMKLMMDYDWPGNVRELENTVARCVVLTPGRHIGVETLPDKIRSEAGTSKEFSLWKNEKALIATVMGECNWNKNEAARLLDISRGTLYSKLKKYDIRP